MIQLKRKAKGIKKHKKITGLKIKAQNLNPQTSGNNQNLIQLHTSV